MGRTLNGNSDIVEIDLYTIAANIYIERGAHIAEGLILYGLLSLPLMVQYEQSVQTRWIHASSCVYVANRSNLGERNVGAEDGLRDKEAYQGQSITKSRVTSTRRG